MLSASLWQHFSPEILSRLFVSSTCIFKRMHCFYFFITAPPPPSCCEKLVCTQLFLELHLGFSFCHINAFPLSFFVFASHLLHKTKKKKKKKRSRRTSHFVGVISFSFHQIIYSAVSHVLCHDLILNITYQAGLRLLIKTQYRNEQLFFQETINLSGCILLRKDVN